MFHFIRKHPQIIYANLLELNVLSDEEDKTIFIFILKYYIAPHSLSV